MAKSKKKVAQATPVVADSPQLKEERLERQVAAIKRAAETNEPLSTEQFGQPAEQAEGRTIVTLTLKGLDKRGRNAVYLGAAVSLRFPIAAFPGKVPPTSIPVDGLAGPRAPKAKLTAEERKAARANAPKLTLAEKVARAEERTAALKAKLPKSEAVAV